MCLCWMMDEKRTIVMDEKRTIMVRGLILYEKKSRKYTTHISLFPLSFVIWNTGRSSSQGAAARPDGPAPSRCSGPAAARDAARLSAFAEVWLFCPLHFQPPPHHTSSAPENTSASATVAAIPADGDFLWSCPLIGWQASNREQLVRGWCISERLHFRFRGCLVNAPDPASGRKRSDGGNNLFSGRPRLKLLMNLTWIWRQESRGTNHNFSFICLVLLLLYPWKWSMCNTEAVQQYLHGI